MKKQPYTLSALFTATQKTVIPSATDLAAHRQIHASGIPQFTISQSKIILMQIHFTADPTPLTPEYPDNLAQLAAQRHLQREIKAQYPHHGEIRYKLEPEPIPNTAAT